MVLVGLFNFPSMKCHVVRIKKCGLLQYFGITHCIHVKMTRIFGRDISTVLSIVSGYTRKRRRETRIERITWVSPMEARWAIEACNVDILAQLLPLPSFHCHGAFRQGLVRRAEE
jgi:hypothetical protein